jgi:hypothetical protein
MRSELRERPLALRRGRDADALEIGTFQAHVHVHVFTVFVKMQKRARLAIKHSALSLIETGQRANVRE